jgi:hypothetical protein
VIKDISSPVEQSHWLKLLASRIGTEEKVLSDILQKSKNSEKRQAVSESAETRVNREKGLEEKILGIILAFPKECRREIDQIDVRDFQNEKERAIMDAIKGGGENFSLENVKALFSDYETGKLLEEIVFETEVRFGGELGDGRERLDPIGELHGYIERLKGNKRKEKIFQIMQDIRSAEASGDKAGAKLLMGEFQKLMEEMKEAE